MLDKDLSNYILKSKSFPIVKENDILKLSLELMSYFKIGITVVCDEENLVKSIFTDGDFRRLILNNQKPLPALLVTEMSKISNIDFLYIDINTSLSNAIEIMKKNKILNLPVLNRKKLIGLLNLGEVINFIGK